MTTTVNTKGQVTIPEPLRSRYGFHPGTKVEWIERNGQVIPIRLMTLEELRNFLPDRPGEPSLSEVLLAERRADREREDR